MRTALLLVLLAAAPVAKLDPGLVGTWGLGGGRDVTFELRADGSGSFAGAPVRWSTAGSKLVFEANGQREVIDYARTGEELMLSQNGVPTPWNRLAGATAPMPSPKGGPGAGAPPQVDRQLRELLLSSAWCSFKYSQILGTTSTERVVFSSDGNVVIDARAETVSTGPSGTYAGFSKDAQRGRWEVRDGRLWLGVGGAPLQPVNGRVNYNSNGSPIIVADGKEYMLCR
jgi:hypothetical protein